MNEYNDYVGMTRRYLKNYRQLQITLKNLTEDREASRTMLQDESVAISRYGCELGGGSGELNAVESAANRRIEITKRIKDIQRDSIEIDRVIRKVDNAMEGLNEVDRDLVWGHYVDGYSWMQLGIKHGYTEKWARDHGSRAVKQVAFMIFGIASQPQQLHFVFAV